MKRKGFTLIELLVVIAVIALLMAVLLPALAKAKEQARCLVCQTKLRTLGQAIRLYADENHDKFLCQDWGTMWTPPIPEYECEWYTRILPYIGKAGYGSVQHRGAALRCPSGVAIKDFGNADADKDWAITIDYGLHGYGATINDKGQSAIGRLSRIKNPYRFASFFDFYFGSITYGPVYEFWTGRSISSVRYQYMATYPADTVLEQGKYAPFLYRHKKKGRGLNAVFADGHVDFLPKLEKGDPEVPAGTNWWDIWKYEWQRMCSSGVPLGGDENPLK